jgi:hypothetical protein
VKEKYRDADPDPVSDTSQGISADLTESEEIHSEDFQFVLKELLKVYQQILEEDLKRIKAPEQLKKEAEKNPPNCDDELKLADTIFQKFFTEEVAMRLLPAEGRKLLGPIEKWRWCMPHIRCCIIFGWLVCRRARTFRAFVYYLYRYWLCIRQTHGNTLVGRQLSPEDLHDFQVLVQELARAYKPYLTDQLATVEFPLGLPDEVLKGKIDCFEGEEEGGAVFERFLTVDSVQALLGKDAFAAHSGDPFFWFCRCWCLCAIRFGCCLARSHFLMDIVYCLLFYRRCLRECFGPIVCELTDPKGCVAEEANLGLKAMVVPVKGSAGGGGFHHYVLEWSKDSSFWHASNFHYPPIPTGGGIQGNGPVFGGLLAYFDTTAQDPGLYFIRMTVYSAEGTTHTCSLPPFSLFKKDVRILGINAYTTLDKSEFDPTARFVENVPVLCTRPAGTFEVSFGELISIWGSAFVGGCEGKQIKRYMIDYWGPGSVCVTDPNAPGWSNIWSVEYDPFPSLQSRDVNMKKDTDVLTSQWGPECIVPTATGCAVVAPNARLYPNSYQTHWGSCKLSGLITLRLVVTDTEGNNYYDTQCIWIDNKEICAVIRIDAVPKCDDLLLSTFAKPPDCSIPWDLPISGIAYDEYIDESLPLTRPNDNFDYYFMRVSKQGGSEIDIPILDPTGSCFFGTSRVGNPGIPCSDCKNPDLLDPGAVFGTLTKFDLRAVDPICKASVPYASSVPDNFTLPRGECCVYTFRLWVYDRTKTQWGPHWKEAIPWSVKICNDLK